MSVRTFAMSSVLALALGAGGALAQTTWSGSSSPEDLRYRLDILDAELADIRARLGGTVGSAVPAPSGTGGGISDDRVNQLEAEIRRLTASVEQMQNQLNRIAKDATNRFGDIEFRLNELEGNPNDGTVPPIGGGQQTGQGIASITQQPAGGDVSVTEQGDLDRAANDVRQGRFDQAEDNLRRFLNQYQNSPLTGHAWYWLGESQFVRGQHAEAARSYLNGYNFERTGPQAPANLYKLGVTLGRLGQLNEACLTLREVPAQFPNAPDGLVGKAQVEAAQLTCG